MIDDPELKIKIVRQCMPVINFNMVETDKVSLSVPTEAIEKDDKGYYVWKAEDQEVLNPNKHLEKSFTVEKTYITPGQMFRRSSGYAEYQILKDHGTLSLNDIVVYDHPHDIRDGERVFFPMNRYILMPGDKVKVVIGK